jgi:hypothetical protein
MELFRRTSRSWIIIISINKSEKNLQRGSVETDNEEPCANRHQAVQNRSTDKLRREVNASRRMLYQRREYRQAGRGGRAVISSASRRIVDEEAALGSAAGGDLERRRRGEGEAPEHEEAHPAREGRAVEELLQHPRHQHGVLLHQLRHDRHKNHRAPKRRGHDTDEKGRVTGKKQPCVN